MSFGISISLVPFSSWPVSCGIDACSNVSSFVSSFVRRQGGSSSFLIPHSIQCHFESISPTHFPFPIFHFPFPSPHNESSVSFLLPPSFHSSPPHVLMSSYLQLLHHQALFLELQANTIHSTFHRPSLLNAEAELSRNITSTTSPVFARSEIMGENEKPESAATFFNCDAIAMRNSSLDLAIALR